MWLRWKGQEKGGSGRLAPALAGLLAGGVLGLMLGVGGGWVGQAAARPAVAPMAAAPAGAKPPTIALGVVPTSFPFTRTRNSQLLSLFLEFDLETKAIYASSH